MNHTRPNNEDDEPQDLSHEVFDEADQASMIQMAETEQALAHIRGKVAPEKHPGFDGKTCVECGDKIPKERLKMGKVRCVHCQGALEIKSKLYSQKKDY